MLVKVKRELTCSYVNDTLASAEGPIAPLKSYLCTPFDLHASVTVSFTIFDHVQPQLSDIFLTRR